jgi:metallo-beta-lactamase family protein
MRVQFHGAADGEVTGSCHLVECAGKRILFDCGMIQGGREAEARNLEPFGFEPAAVDALVLSHAHIDHVGRVPLLVKRGFRGPIFAQTATCGLLPVMLLDAASLAERKADIANREHARGKHDVEPIYAREDVEAVLPMLQPLPYQQRRQILPGIELHLSDAGHILGSCIVDLSAEGKTVVFSGDIGMRGTPILRDPEPPPSADLVLMESTYGDRNHRDRLATVAELGTIFEQAHADGGNVIIPAFAVGRSQELLYWFAQNFERWQLARWQIFLDSPMAAKVTAIYDQHEALFDEAAAKVWRGRIKPFALPNLHIAESVEDSKAINRIRGGAIIIAGSGMANGGRVRHHLYNNLADRRSHVVFAGYQADGTLGRILVNGVRRVRLFGDDIGVQAQVHTVGGLSAHADQQGLLDWYASGTGKPPVVLVHGEPRAREALAAELRRRHGIEVTLSQAGASIEA